jgi:heme exporter protein C
MARLLDRALPALAGASVIYLAYLTFNVAPQEEVMGEIQRIFYFHAPAGLASLMLLGTSGVLSLIFLLTRRTAYDHAARAMIEAGFVFASLVLVTGPVWAKQAWGAWWTGEPRLTSFLILWLVYAGYLLFRSSSDSARTPRLAAIIAAVAGLDIPLIYYAPHWWNRNHPDPTKMDFSGDIKRTFFTGILVTLLLAAALVRLAYRRFRLEESLAPNH